MVRSDISASGVMFTMDTESGFDGVVFITASYGLGETVVQGAMNRTSSRSQGHPGPEGKGGDPPQPRLKLIKMVFADKKEAGKSTRTVDVPEAERNVTP